MAVDILMPKLGMTMEEGKLIEWSKKEKDQVNNDELLFVIESDKVTFEVESPGSGFLAILKDPDEIYPVGELLAYLAESEQEYEELKKGAGSQTEVVDSAAAAPAAEAGQPARQEAQAATPGKALPKGKVRATPGARKLAKQKGIDLTTVAGTGPNGRISRDDVLKAIDTAAATPAVPAAATGPVIGGRRLLREEPLKGMRGTISRRMMDSLHNTAQMTAFSEWDVTELMKLRKQINQSQEKAPEELRYRASVPGMMVFFLSRVLKEMPEFNASVDGNTVKYWDDANVGVAVAVPDGLLVPVVQGADRKSLGEIQRDLEGLIERARSMKLLPDDMSGGTFTLSNLGSYGAEWETVILNPPEVALLGIGRGSKKPVVINDEIVVRNIMPVSLTYDHRLIDGAVAGAFRNRLKELVENPGLVMACDRLGL